MRSSVVPVLYWSYWANVLYILGMFGYLTIDTITYLFTSFDNKLSCYIYVLIAIIFVIDAILYTIDWYMYAIKLRENEDEPLGNRTELVACIFQHLGSYFYLIGALLNFNRAQFIDKILLFNFIGIIAFLIDAGLTFLGWHISFRKKPSANPKRGCVPQDVYMWAHIMYIIACVIYLCATTLAYRLYINYQVINPNGVLIIQMMGDLIYLFDAYLYYDGWQRDKQEYDANTERQKLIELNLVKQLTTDNVNNAMKNDENNQISED